MRPGLVGSWRALDRYLLLNRPDLWMARSHYVAVAFLLTLAAFLAIGQLRPVTLIDVPNPERSLIPALAAVGLLASGWLAVVYRFQVTPHMTGSAGWTRPVLTAFVLLVLASPVFAYFRVLDARIARLVDYETLRHDSAIIDQVYIPGFVFPGPRLDSQSLVQAVIAVRSRAPQRARPYFDSVADSVSDAIVRVLAKYSGLAPSDIRVFAHVSAEQQRFGWAARILVDSLQPVRRGDQSARPAVRRRAVQPLAAFRLDSITASLELLNARCRALIRCNAVSDSIVEGYFYYYGLFREGFQPWVEGWTDAQAAIYRLRGLFGDSTLDVESEGGRLLLGVARAYTRSNLNAWEYAVYRKAARNAAWVASRQAGGRTGVFGAYGPMTVLGVFAIAFAINVLGRLRAILARPTQVLLALGGLLLSLIVLAQVARPWEARPVTLVLGLWCGLFATALVGAAWALTSVRASQLSLAAGAACLMMAPVVPWILAAYADWNFQVPVGEEAKWSGIVAAGCIVLAVPLQRILNRLHAVRQA